MEKGGKWTSLPKAAPCRGWRPRPPGCRLVSAVVHPSLRFFVLDLAQLPGSEEKPSGLNSPAGPLSTQGVTEALPGRPITSSATPPFSIPCSSVCLYAGQERGGGLRGLKPVFTAEIAPITPACFSSVAHRVPPASIFSTVEAMSASHVDHALFHH